jgi:hypothetical protein
MDDSRLTNLNQIQKFLESSQELVLTLDTTVDKYQFVKHVIDRFNYSTLKRKEKKIILFYIKKITGYKKAQVMRLLKKALVGNLQVKEYKRFNPNIIYKPRDIKLLEQTDELHSRLSAVATKEILRREYTVFGNPAFANLSHISSSHINNLRQAQMYKASWVNGTKAREINIGKTKKPENNSIPGSIRVDTVHQRDVFHINAVDEIIQWEVVACVPQITEEYLSPALQLLLEQFPFVVFNFHSDKGVEFVNKVVANILNKLLINQTKSRSRHCNDNALVESKNASIIRKNMGYQSISRDAKTVAAINDYYQNYFNVYLNYHRPCLFVTETITDEKGREKKIYGQATTPYEKLKEVSKEKHANFLRSDITLEKLDTLAYQKSDNEFAKILRHEEQQLFTLIETRNI